MKQRFAVLLFLGWLIPAGAAWAESPVVVSHTLTGYNMGTDSVILNYILTIENSGSSSISNVTLSYVPLMIVSKDMITLNIGNLNPQAKVQIPFTLTTPIVLDQSKFSQQPLFWAGTYTGNDGNLIEFPANSITEGAL